MESVIRPIEHTHIDDIVQGFKDSNWTIKPKSLFEKYLQEQKDGKRTCFVAYEGAEFAGYVTLLWHCKYALLRSKSIPEIADLNVLPAFRSQGIGSALLNRCETEAAKKSSVVGLGVGLYGDYGPAQRLYVKRGYIPTGKGITYRDEPVKAGKSYPVDDDLILWFFKSLS